MISNGGIEEVGLPCILIFLKYPKHEDQGRGLGWDRAHGYPASLTLESTAACPTARRLLNVRLWDGGALRGSAVSSQSWKLHFLSVMAYRNAAPWRRKPGGHFNRQQHVVYLICHFLLTTFFPDKPVALQFHSRTLLLCLRVFSSLRLFVALSLPFFFLSLSLSFAVASELDTRVLASLSP